MGEKRYYLTEVEEGTLIASHFKLAITESELKRRLEQAIDFIEGEDNDFAPTELTDVGFNGALKILLHGEGKEQQPPEGLFHGPGLPEKKQSNTNPDDFIPDPDLWPDPLEAWAEKHWK